MHLKGVRCIYVWERGVGEHGKCWMLTARRYFDCRVLRLDFGPIGALISYLQNPRGIFQAPSLANTAALF